MIRGNEEMKKMEGDYLKKWVQLQIAKEDYLWLSLSPFQELTMMCKKCYGQ